MTHRDAAVAISLGVLPCCDRVSSCSTKMLTPAVNAANRGDRSVAATYSGTVVRKILRLCLRWIGFMPALITAAARKIAIRPVCAPVASRAIAGALGQAATRMIRATPPTRIAVSGCGIRRLKSAFIDCTLLLRRNLAPEQHTQDLVVETTDRLIVERQQIAQTDRCIGKSSLCRDADVIVCRLNQRLGNVLLWRGVVVVAERFFPAEPQRGSADCADEFDSPWPMDDIMYLAHV